MTGASTRPVALRGTGEDVRKDLDEAQSPDNAAGAGHAYPSLALLDGIAASWQEPTEARSALGHFLRRLAHDVNGSLGALRLELDSLRWYADELREVVRTGDSTRVVEANEGVEEIRENLESVLQTVTGLVGGLRRVGVAWTRQARTGGTDERGTGFVARESVAGTGPESPSPERSP